MEPKKERYRRIRGAILKFLAYEHGDSPCENPGSIDMKVLHYSLDNIGYPITEEELRSHLFYLENKTPPLISIERRKVGRLEIMMVCITPDGLDILDGFKTDAGIDTRF
jgi:hypothetical protein